MLGLLVMLIEDRIYHLIKLLLYTAKEENAKVCATKLQKVFFLLEKETGKDLGLEFKPWFFGPYSEKLDINSPVNPLTWETDLEPCL